MKLTSNGFNGISKVEDYNINNQEKFINTFQCVERNNTYEINAIYKNKGDLGNLNPTLFLSSGEGENSGVGDEETGSQTNLYEPTSEKPKEKPKNKKENKLIFKIKKVSKLAGRRSLNKHIQVLVKHGKSAKDNITTKVKTCFINRATKYTNQLYKLYRQKKGKKEIILLQKIEPKFSQAYTKEENQNFLNKKMKDIFSMKVSKKCSHYNEDYNMHQINKLYKEEQDAKEVIKIMNSTVKDLYLEYINETKKIEGFNLDEDVQKIEEKYKDNDENYAQKYRKIAIELIDILNAKGRGSQKSDKK